MQRKHLFSAVAIILGILVGTVIYGQMSNRSLCNGNVVGVSPDFNVFSLVDGNIYQYLQYYGECPFRSENATVTRIVSDEGNSVKVIMLCRSREQAFLTCKDADKNVIKQDYLSFPPSDMICQKYISFLKYPVLSISETRRTSGQRVTHWCHFNVLADLNTLFSDVNSVANYVMDVGNTKVFVTENNVGINLVPIDENVTQVQIYEMEG